MISGLTLLNRRIQAYNEKHLTRISMRKIEQAQNGRHRYFVVERFTVKLEECLEHFDIVTTAEIRKRLIKIKSIWMEYAPRCEALYFSKDGNCVARNADHAGLLHDLFLERVDWI